MHANIIAIETTADPRVAVFCNLTENELRNRLDPAQALFIAESPKVIDRALREGFEPVSLMCERRHIEGDAAGIIAMCGDEVPIYTGSREVLASITGYKLTRGVLCAMRRKPELPAAEVLRDARRIAVLDGVCDATNTGAIFRSAAALGIDAVALTPTACDPLNRRAARVSMGTVFCIPWTRIASVNELHDYGFKTVALALTDKSVSIDDPRLNAEPRLALVLGTEGDGLDKSVIADADYTARIPMHREVDSLNVAAAAAVAFWQLCERKPNS